MKLKDTGLTAEELKDIVKKQMTILIAAHFSTILVPQDKKQARKCPFYSMSLTLAKSRNRKYL